MTLYDNYREKLETIVSNFSKSTELGKKLYTFTKDFLPYAHHDDKGLILDLYITTWNHNTCSLDIGQVTKDYENPLYPSRSPMTYGFNLAHATIALHLKHSLYFLNVNFDFCSFGNNHLSCYTTFENCSFLGVDFRKTQTPMCKNTFTKCDIICSKFSNESIELVFQNCTISTDSVIPTRKNSFFENTKIESEQYYPNQTADSAKHKTLDSPKSPSQSITKIPQTTFATKGQTAPDETSVQINRALSLDWARSWHLGSQ